MTTAINATPGAQTQAQHSTAPAVSSPAFPSRSTADSAVQQQQQRPGAPAKEFPVFPRPTRIVAWRTRPQDNGGAPHSARGLPTVPLGCHLAGDASHLIK
ncbi:hypothetical protein GGTG_04776 [Gaeumannomyces tritici R3-111a-1]|uniref:Uncharacterized protein n=1 Tax=Gaeumannomyces tritici (strain R3-111a-1) TaxID=644352 RepID=J3NU25_GAET3|nr:hypothetical protein GGTG_04776 [Gaeumannomyces tritici R3-111a-1]EJT79692.1 hypothetical protein GGTG_04776 [Gaeumannomyces tritici R3-111a-1]